MFKNLEIWVTEKCNSRCLMCHAWKGSDAIKKDLSTEKLQKILNLPEFKEVQDIQISGGEPTQRKDLFEIIMMAVEGLPKLKKVLLATNGTRPNYTKNVFKKIRQKTDINLKLCVSLEGDKAVNEKIRGIDNYDSAVRTLKVSSKSVSGLQTMILMTLTKINCNEESLSYVKKIAELTESDFSYRIAQNSPHHFCKESVIPDSSQKLEVIKFTQKFFNQNPFLRSQKEYLLSRKTYFLKGCQAGKIFANIRVDGGIYPCINSCQKIGDYKKGVFTKDFNLGEYESCSSCCNEACFYPNINYEN